MNAIRTGDYVKFRLPKYSGGSFFVVDVVMLNLQGIKNMKVSSVTILTALRQINIRSLFL